MINTFYYIIIRQRKQLMLRFLDIRVIINDKEIYPLLTSKPVVIPVEKDHLSIVISDGFHFTKPLELTYNGPGYFNFEVTCMIDDLALLGALFVLIVFYLLGLFTGLLILQLLSFLPVVWLLVVYYINRKDFLYIKKK